MKQFLNRTEVNLINGGYLSNPDGKPVSNPEFEAAQRQAEYVVTFAEMAKGKTFKATAADSLEDLRAEVSRALAEKDVTYVTPPAKFVGETTNLLKNEALSFIKNTEEIESAAKINKFLQKFNVLNDFEAHGLFFEQGVVKLNRIYTVEEVKTAVTSVINLL